MTKNKRFTTRNCVFYTDNETGWEFQSYGEVVDLMNKLNDENKQLHRIIIEDEKMIQSIYEELSKLRLIKKNLREIKTKWNWIMESVDYD